MRFVLIVVSACLLLFLTVALVSAEMSRVTVKKTAVKNSPRLFSKTIKTLHYADQVEVVDWGEGWVRVRLESGESGWVRVSHLSKSSLSLRAGSQMVDVDASEEELTLAGKGFDRQVEQRYRQRNADADYDWIDRMEGYRHDNAELTRFLRQGGLVARAGGRHEN